MACIQRSYDKAKVLTTGAVPAMKPEATAIGRSARWPLEITLNRLMGAGFAYRNLGLLRYSRRHIVFECL